MKCRFKAAETLFAEHAVLSAPDGGACGACCPEKKELNAAGGALSWTDERRLCRGDFL
ncbi:MAG: hypothetical protein IJM42_04315 [Synergistes sp.]|nr:hypothetical protein [Synergistes sp.]MCR5336076.1 hypothetical protein [Synergistes sp.]